MANRNVNTFIKKYAANKTYSGDERAKGLKRLALSLRDAEGIQGDALLNLVLEANDKICAPPLSVKGYVEPMVKKLAERPLELTESEADKRALRMYEIKNQKPVKRIIGGCFVDVKDEPIYWLWIGRFALGFLHMIHGFMDAGKGYFTFFLAAIVSRGGVFPNGEFCKKGSVLIVGTEEAMPYAKRKLVAQGADIRNVHYLVGYTEGEAEYPILLENTDVIQSKCDEIKAAGLPVSLVIVDPILQMLGVCAKDNTKVQAALAPVKEFAEKNNVCFLCVNHDGKQQQETAANRSIGAQALMGKMRIAYTAKKDLKTSEDDEYPQHTLAASKFNIGRRPKGITYRIVECPDDPEIGMVEILDIDGNFTADDNRTAGDDSKLDQCCQWLQQAIPTEGKLRDDVFAEGRRSGFGRDTLYAAFKTLGGRTEGGGRLGKVRWLLSLPGSDSETSLTGSDSEVKNAVFSSVKCNNLLSLPGYGVTPGSKGSEHSAPTPLPEFAEFSEQESTVDTPTCCEGCRHEKPCEMYQYDSRVGCKNFSAADGKF